MINYRENFKAELAKLNPRQREAVEHIEGPVLVIAGPGTGKTQIIAARIGYILENTHVGPHNILALTYTEAGSANMRTRLAEFIGPDAHRVTIGTYHEFCNMVMQENPDIFGIRDMEPVSPLEEHELLRKLIDGFDARHPLKRPRGDVYWEAERLKDLFGVMKREHWDAQYIETHVNDYLSKHLSTNGEDLRRYNELIAAAHEFPRYQQLMRERSRYDFDDMMLWTLEKFAEMPELLLSYQERYHYFLVDEYQDTSGTQNDLLFTLANFWDVPNVFAVGDDDQSIFRFQGANVTNIISFHERYKEHVKVIVLEENYRSSSKLLSLADSIIDRNSERLVKQLPELNLSKKLKAASVFADSDVMPEVRTYYNDIHETAGVAREIIALRDQGVNLGEVAVLYRNHSHIKDMQKYLETLDVPINVRKRSNILESPFIQNLLSVLRYVSEEAQLPYSGETELFHVLHLPFFGIEPKAIAEIARDIRKKHDAKQPGSSSSKEKRVETYWRDEIAEARGRVSGSLFDSDLDESFTRVKQLSQDIEYWITNMHSVSLLELVEKVVTRGGVLSWLMQQPEREWLIQELNTFYDFVKSEAARHRRLDLPGLIKTIDLMEEERLPIEINKTMFAENGVNLVTVHSAKGLEFRYVFVIGVDKSGWDSKRGGSGSYKYPPNLIPRTHENVDEEEERRRLFYVAITRAKEHLVVSHSAKTRDDKVRDRSRFITEMEHALGSKSEPVHLEDDDILSYSEKMVRSREGKPHLPGDYVMSESFLHSILENYSLSVSNLNSYLKCQVSFYFEKVLRVPQEKNQYMAFGTAMHEALYNYFDAMKKNKDRWPDDQFLFDEFIRQMHRERPSFTEEQFNNRLRYGLDLLPRYLAKYKDAWNKIVIIERKISHTQVRGIPINGKVDKAEFTGKQANVVDYKTGQYSKSKNKFSPPGYKPPQAKDLKEHEFAHGGDYWRQAVFYKLLIENDPSRDWKVASVEFDFLEPERYSGEFFKQRVDITPEHERIVADQIEQAYHGIMNLEFSNGCKDKWCKWCNFIRERFVEVEVEEAEV
jgi:DNA helicase-2/ATP-dependent DNA helicase PcrA